MCEAHALQDGHDDDRGERPCHGGHQRREEPHEGVHDDGLDALREAAGQVEGLAIGALHPAVPGCSRVGEQRTAVDVVGEQHEACHASIWVPDAAPDDEFAEGGEGEHEPEEHHRRRADEGGESSSHPVQARREHGTDQGSFLSVTEQSAGRPAQDQDARFKEQVLPELEVLFRVARRLTGDAIDAEDLVQDALLRAYRGFSGFDGRYPRAWLLTILRNAHLNEARRRRPILLDDDFAQRVPARGADGRLDGTLEQALHADLDPLVQQALADLSTDHRVVIALVDLDQLSYQEAADVLRVPVGTVMSRLHRARRKVRDHLLKSGHSEVRK